MTPAVRSDWEATPRATAVHFVVALGVASQSDLTAGVIVIAVLGIGLAAALRWTCFDSWPWSPAVGWTQAAEGRERNTFARDSYTYNPCPMVAGIILVALGLERTLAHLDESLDHLIAGVRPPGRDRHLPAGPRGHAAPQRPHAQRPAP